jgi:uncharacterized protein YxjI
MRYVMRQKLLSWGDDFYIRDEQGRDVFFVDGKAFSFGDKLSFQDLAGHELASLSKRCSRSALRTRSIAMATLRRS